MSNLLLQTDIYKLGHLLQYKPGITKVYSYFCCRSAKTFPETVFFGLRYYLQKYLSQTITQDHVEEFCHVHDKILGPTPPEVRAKMTALAALGYLPLEISAVEEGSVVPVQNALFTITNTHPDFYWVVGFVESLLLKVWYPMTVATHSRAYQKEITDQFKLTVDDEQLPLLPWMVHDFGYRGDSSEEGAAISGAAHLLSFAGSDTIPAFAFVQDYYMTTPVMGSVPASEHSVMCSFGKEGELEAYRHMLKLYPTGIVSIVSDTYDIWNVLTNFAETLKEDILARDGKVVFRPDSGNPVLIICGDPRAKKDSPARLGCIRLLDQMFGHTVNSKGYKVLNSKVGLIYGDGMYLERYRDTLWRLEEMGYAASNLVIGVGGILRNHSRDTLGCAIKATYVEIDGKGVAIMKDPITDKGKKSHQGLLQLHHTEAGYSTVDNCETADRGLLAPVFRDGQILRYDNPFAV